MSDYLVVLDACVLVPACLRDTLLRLAQEPRLYVPKWSDDIIAETVHTLENRLGYSIAQTTRLVAALKTHFPHAWVAGFHNLVPLGPNDDQRPQGPPRLCHCRQSHAQAIVTFNTSHFLAGDLYLGELFPENPMTS